MRLFVVIVQTFVLPQLHISFYRWKEGERNVWPSLVYRNQLIACDKCFNTVNAVYPGWMRNIVDIKLYIAGPMTGIVLFNYPAFYRAMSDLGERGYDTLSPTDSEDKNKSGTRFGMSREWYLKHAIRMVTKADGIALLEGWEQSEGAKLEVHVGQHLGLDIRPIGMWLKP